MEDNVLIQPQVHYDDEINLRELFTVLWVGKIKIIAITAMFAIMSVFYALSVPNQYKASVSLVPAQQQSGGISGALAQLGGIASLAGVSLGSGDSSESQIAQRIMQSWSFIDDFIKSNNLEIDIFAAEGWDRASGKLNIDEDLYNSGTTQWLVKNEETNKVGMPSSWRLFETFTEILSVSEDKKTGLVSMSIEYYSPQIAKQWLDMYISAINKHMQERQMAKVTRNIEYLEAQIAKTTIAEMQEVFYTIIEEQLKSKMLAEANPDYAFVVVSPSMVPEQKSQPKRALICILGTLLGGMLSILMVLIMHYAKKSN
jgi:uncharacterized protein involved in exopolysaccharide biosynthesis|tara:strand:+ start:1300 stop:2241 length:942 start_codon:yes stop_codon:yes gene_type:complete